jgi:hypothetical protein
MNRELRFYSCFSKSMLWTKKKLWILLSPDTFQYVRSILLGIERSIHFCLLSAKSIKLLTEELYYIRYLPIPRAGRVHHTSSFDEFADTPSNDGVVFLLGSNTESWVGTRASTRVSSSSTTPAHSTSSWTAPPTSRHAAWQRLTYPSIQVRYTILHIEFDTRPIELYREGSDNIKYFLLAKFEKFVNAFKTLAIFSVACGEPITLDFSGFSSSGA